MAKKYIYQIEITKEQNWGEPVKVPEIMQFVSEKLRNLSDINRVEVKKIRKRG